MKGKGLILLAGFLAFLSLLGLTATASLADTYNFLTQWSSGSFPKGIAVDSAGGHVYVSNADNRILKTLTNGSPVTSWGGFGPGNGFFNNPRGVALDPSANVYVADTDNHRIQKFQSTGAFVSAFGSFGSGDGQFNKPAGVFVDSSGNIYVADMNNHRIQVFKSDGTFSSAFGSFGTGNGQFNGPSGVAVDSSGNIYVADTNNNRIQKFTGGGVFVLAWGSFGSGNGQFNLPNGISVDSADRLYVADTENHRIQKFTEDGIFVTTWGSFGIAIGQFDGPCGTAIDTNGDVYVADTDNYRVQVFEPVPEITLTTPNGGETWGAGSQVTVSWTYVGNPGSTVRVDLFKGGIFDRTIATSTSMGGGGTGSFLWTVPINQTPGVDYTVKLTSTTSEGTFTDTSDADFTIVGPSILVAVPNGGEIWTAGTQFTIRWTYEGNPGSSVRIDLLKGGSVNRTITSSVSIGGGGSGSYIWTIPSSQIAGADYTIRITSTSNSLYFDTSDAPFTINAPSLTVASPNGGEIYGAGAQITISWTFQGNPGANVRIDLYKGGVYVKTAAYGAAVGTGGNGSFL